MRNLGAWKKRARLAVLALVGFDALLFWVNWQFVGAPPEALSEQRDRLREQHALLGADVRRATEIRNRLPQTERDCDQFLVKQFLGEESGYSTVVEDLTRIAVTAGLDTRSVNYKPQELEKRKVVEVDVAATVEGDYRSIVRFINGLERSENFYLLESLGLASSQGGQLRLNLQLKTYFRLKQA